MTSMKNLRRLAGAVALTASVALVTAGCGPNEPAPASATPPSAVQSTPPSDGAAAQPAGDAAPMLDEAVKSARVLRTVHVKFSTSGIDNLLARSYAADVTTAPAVAARGSANLKINGQYVQSDFKVVEGNLWVKNADGKYANTGSARGKFDPAVLLDPKRGIAALVEATTDAKVDGAPSKVDGHDAVKITGTIPAEAATVLVPKEQLGDKKTLPISIWLSPEQPRMVMQLIITAGEGSLTLGLDKAEPFTVTAG